MDVSRSPSPAQNSPLSQPIEQQPLPALAFVNICPTEESGRSTQFSTMRSSTSMRGSTSTANLSGISDSEASSDSENEIDQPEDEIENLLAQQKAMMSDDSATKKSSMDISSELSALSVRSNIVSILKPVPDKPQQENFCNPPRLIAIARKPSPNTKRVSMQSEKTNPQQEKPIPEKRKLKSPPPEQEIKRLKEKQ